MGLIESDGLVKKGRRELRQVPQKHTWSSGLFCSRNGHLVRRFYNVADGSWMFGEPIELALQFKTGKIGLHLQGHGFTPLETIICMAWRRRGTDSNGEVLRVGKRRQKIAKHLRWNGGEEDDAEDQTPLEGETWWSIDAESCRVVLAMLYQTRADCAIQRAALQKDSCMQARGGRRRWTDCL